MNGTVRKKHVVEDNKKKPEMPKNGINNKI